MMNMQPIVFDGLSGIEISTSKVRLVVVTELGPRIAFLGRPGGDNLLYWKNDDLGYDRWRLLGGHRVWVTRPGADESEDAYASDNEPCQVRILENGLEVTGSLHPVLKTKRGLRLEVIGETSVRVTSFLTNCSPFLYSGGVWAPTCIDPAGGKEFAIPLGDKSSSWDLIKIIIPRKFASHTAPVNDPQISYNNDFMIVRPQGIETKRMVMAPLGLVAMTWAQKDISFIKHSPFNPHGIYPHGCNLAIYNSPGNMMFEMETYGQEQTILPGETIENREIWKLTDTVFDWSDPIYLQNEMKIS